MEFRFNILIKEDGFIMAKHYELIKQLVNENPWFVLPHDTNLSDVDYSIEYAKKCNPGFFVVEVLQNIEGEYVYEACGIVSAIEHLGCIQVDVCFSREYNRFLPVKYMFKEWCEIVAEKWQKPMRMNVRNKAVERWLKSIGWKQTDIKDELEYPVYIFEEIK